MLKKTSKTLFGRNLLIFCIKKRKMSKNAPFFAFGGFFLLI